MKLQHDNLLAKVLSTTPVLEFEDVAAYVERLVELGLDRPLVHTQYHINGTRNVDEDSASDFLDLASTSFDVTVDFEKPSLLFLYKTSDFPDVKTLSTIESRTGVVLFIIEDDDYEQFLDKFVNGLTPDFDEQEQYDVDLE